MNHTKKEFWQRAWLEELGVDWRAPLPRVGENHAAAVVRETRPASSPVGPATRPAALPEAERALSASAPSVAAPEATSTPATPAADAASAPVAPTPSTFVAPSEAPRQATVDTPPVAEKTVTAPPAASVPTPAPQRAELQLEGRWRWSWWQAKAPHQEAPAALLLRPWAPATQDDPRGRELLANAMAAVAREPMRPGVGTVGGVTDSGCNLATLQALVAQAPLSLNTESVPVVICMPPNWPLPPQPSRLAGWEVGMSITLPTAPQSLTLALIPAPSVMLRLGAAAKRLAWRALAPIHPEHRPDND